MYPDPLITIVMPLYNKRPYVKRSVESIQRQTFKNWELIIVDDGSTDGSTGEIPTNDNRIRVITQQNAGPAAARNRGIQVASGAFVSFLDADDYYYPIKLAEEVSLLWTQRKAQWTISASNYFNGTDVIFRGIREINGNLLEGSPRVFQNAFAELSFSEWPSSSVCIDKDLLNSVGGFDEQMRCYEIADLYRRCALQQGVLVVNHKPLSCVMDVPGSAFKNTANRLEGLKLMGEKCGQLSQRYPRYAVALKSKGRHFLLTYVAHLILAGEHVKARSYLFESSPYSRDVSWWKLLIASYLPNFALNFLRDIRLASFIKDLLGSNF